MGVDIFRYYGTNQRVNISGGGSPIGLKLKTYDADNQATYTWDAEHPIPRPVSNYKYTYFATLALESDVVGSEIYSDIKFYTGGVPAVPTPNPRGYVAWTGVQLQVADDTDDSYQQATGTPDDSGTDMVTKGVTGSVTDLLSTYTTQNMKSIPLKGGVASIGPLQEATRLSKFIRIQGRVDPNSAPGSTVPAVLYCRYSVTS